MNNVQELKLKNYNNCHACDAFVYLHFAPSQPVTDKDFEKTYLVKHEGEDFFVMLVDFLRFKFEMAPSICTIPATGMEGEEWRTWWLTQHPQTKADSDMCAYFYKKVNI